MINKRGQSSTIAVTIAIVLGIALIVFLIWGFSTNWSMFSGTAGVFTGKSNIDAVEQACQIKCENSQVREFCDASLSVKLTNGSSTTGTCDGLSKGGLITITCPNPCTPRTTPPV